VKFGNGETATALAVNCGGVGNRTRLSLRPERVEIGAKSDFNSVTGKVLELIYLGDHIRARMSVHGNDTFVVKLPNSSDHAQLSVGETTLMSWRAQDCRALDAE
jgi:putative spermidine/putrescine transport system ATP-binding protein